MKEISEIKMSESEVPYHSLSCEEVVLELKTDLSTGLSTAENKIRLFKYGENKIPTQRPSTVLEKLWAQINSTLIYILIAGSVISFSFDHLIDGFFIIGVVFINVTLGYIMESNAENATSVLKDMMSPIAQVLRDGERQPVDSSTLTPGDVFFLQPGDIVPADGRVLRSSELTVLESPLTGESHPIVKVITPCENVKAPLAERKCMVYSGTQVMKGTAACVVVATGANCEIGKISGLLTDIVVVKTPLILQLEKFGTVLSIVIICLAAATFGIAYARGHPVDVGLSMAIGIAVAAIPEGLPACVTVTFSVGVRYMAGRNAIIKTLPAVETLGSVNVICSDKTGTLTRNKMTAKEVITASGAAVKISDDGKIENSNEIAPATGFKTPEDALLWKIMPGILCNDGTIVSEGEVEHEEDDDGDDPLDAPPPVKYGRNIGSDNDATYFDIDEITEELQQQQQQGAGSLPAEESRLHSDSSPVVPSVLSAVTALGSILGSTSAATAATPTTSATDAGGAATSDSAGPPPHGSAKRKLTAAMKMGSIRLTPNGEVLVPTAPTAPTAPAISVTAPTIVAGASAATAPVPTTSSPGTQGVSTFEVHGNPTEACLLSLGIGLSHNHNKIKSIRTHHKRISEITFDSAYKYMATMHLLDAKFVRKLKLAGATSRELLRQGAGEASNSHEEDAVKPNSDRKYKVVFIKGAPERIIAMCDRAPPTAASSFGDNPVSEASAFAKHWTDGANKAATRGMRVLAVGYKIIAADVEFQGHLPLYCGCVLTSLVGIMDPPRPSAMTAIAVAQRAGITVKMITGDHPVTALAIGKMLGLGLKRHGDDIESGGHMERAITGGELDEMIIRSMAEFDECVKNNDIFARTTPEHKIRIVQSLLRQKFVCSMTGDGVNDAPALKAANIGVAMGITGTEVAKDAADMILTDDNFATIVDAVRIGRGTYNNLIKIIACVLPSNAGQAFSILGALIIGVAVPITALQVLWVNMVTSATLGLVLAFDLPDDSLLNEKPRRKGKRLFGRFMCWRLVFVVSLITTAVIGVYQWESKRLNDVNQLRTVSVNTLTVSQMTYLFNCRYLRHNVTPDKMFFGNKWIYAGLLAVAVFQVILTYASPFNYVFDTKPIDGTSWGKVLLCAVSIFILVEAEKFFADLKKRWFASIERQPETRSRAGSRYAMTAGAALF